MVEAQTSESEQELFNRLNQIQRSLTKVTDRIYKGTVTIDDRRWVVSELQELEDVRQSLNSKNLMTDEMNVHIGQTLQDLSRANQLTETEQQVLQKASEPLDKTMAEQELGVVEDVLDEETKEESKAMTVLQQTVPGMNQKSSLHPLTQSQVLKQQNLKSSSDSSDTVQSASFKLEKINPNDSANTERIKKMQDELLLGMSLSGKGVVDQKNVSSFIYNSLLMRKQMLSLFYNSHETVTGMLNGKEQKASYDAFIDQLKQQDSKDKIYKIVLGKAMRNEADELTKFQFQKLASDMYEVTKPVEGQMGKTKGLNIMNAMIGSIQNQAYKMNVAKFGTQHFFLPSPIFSGEEVVQMMRNLDEVINDKPGRFTKAQESHARTLVSSQIAGPEVYKTLLSISKHYDKEKKIDQNEVIVPEFVTPLMDKFSHGLTRMKLAASEEGVVPSSVAEEANTEVMGELQAATQGMGKTILERRLKQVLQNQVSTGWMSQVKHFGGLKIENQQQRDVEREFDEIKVKIMNDMKKSMKLARENWSTSLSHMEIASGGTKPFKVLSFRSTPELQFRSTSSNPRLMSNFSIARAQSMHDFLHLMRDSTITDQSNLGLGRRRELKFFAPSPAIQAQRVSSIDPDFNPGDVQSELDQTMQAQVQTHGPQALGDNVPVIATQMMNPTTVIDAETGNADVQEEAKLPWLMGSEQIEQVNSAISNQIQIDTFQAQLGASEEESKAIARTGIQQDQFGHIDMQRAASDQRKTNLTATMLSANSKTNSALQVLEEQKVQNAGEIMQLVSPLNPRNTMMVPLQHLDNTIDNNHGAAESNDELVAQEEQLDQSMKAITPGGQGQDFVQQQIDQSITNTLARASVSSIPEHRSPQNLHGRSHLSDRNQTPRVGSDTVLDQRMRNELQARSQRDNVDFVQHRGQLSFDGFNAFPVEEEEEKQQVQPRVIAGEMEQESIVVVPQQRQENPQVEELKEQVARMAQQVTSVLQAQAALTQQEFRFNPDLQQQPPPPPSLAQVQQQPVREEEMKEEEVKEERIRENQLSLINQALTNDMAHMEADHREQVQQIFQQASQQVRDVESRAKLQRIIESSRLNRGRVDEEREQKVMKNRQNVEDIEAEIAMMNLLIKKHQTQVRLKEEEEGVVEKQPSVIESLTQKLDELKKIEKARKLVSEGVQSSIDGVVSMRLVDMTPAQLEQLKDSIVANYRHTIDAGIDADELTQFGNMGQFLESKVKELLQKRKDEETKADEEQKVAEDEEAAEVQQRETEEREQRVSDIEARAQRSLSAGYTANFEELRKELFSKFANMDAMVQELVKPSDSVRGNAKLIEQAGTTEPAPPARQTSVFGESVSSGDDQPTGLAAVISDAFTTRFRNTLAKSNRLDLIQRQANDRMGVNQAVARAQVRRGQAVAETISPLEQQQQRRGSDGELQSVVNEQQNSIAQWAQGLNTRAESIEGLEQELLNARQRFQGEIGGRESMLAKLLEQRGDPYEFLQYGNDASAAELTKIVSNVKDQLWRDDPKYSKLSQKYESASAADKEQFDEDYEVIANRLAYKRAQLQYMQDLMELSYSIGTKSNPIDPEQIRSYFKGLRLLHKFNPGAMSQEDIEIKNLIVRGVQKHNQAIAAADFAYSRDNVADIDDALRKLSQRKEMLQLDSYLKGTLNSLNLPSAMMSVINKAQGLPGEQGTVSLELLRTIMSEQIKLQSENVRRERSKEDARDLDEIKQQIQSLKELPGAAQQGVSMVTPGASVADQSRRMQGFQSMVGPRYAGFMGSRLRNFVSGNAVNERKAKIAEELVSKNAEALARYRPHFKRISSVNQVVSKNRALVMELQRRLAHDKGVDRRVGRAVSQVKNARRMRRRSRKRFSSQRE